MPKLTLIFVFLFFTKISFSQKEATIKYGKIAVEDFNIISPIVDSNANAVVIADIGNIEFEGTNNGWFRTIFKHHKRIKIINKKSFDIATVKINLYKISNDRQEKIEDVKGATYNLENNNIITTKLSSKAFISEKTDNQHTTEKFTFENIKEGCIIEYSYTLSSDFLFNLQDWYFQDYYPTLWSEFEVSIPEYFHYIFNTKGLDNPYDLKKNVTNEKFKLSKIVQKGASTPLIAPTLGTDNFEMEAKVYHVKWTLKDIPGLRLEPFTTTLRNHITKINFQLSQIRMPEQIPEDVVQSWEQIADKSNKDERFGIPINKSNGWLDADIKGIIGNATTSEEKAQKIYTFIRNNFTKTGEGTMLSINTSLKDIFKNRSGTVADINLLLIAMLRHEKIEVNPVLLSTRDNGVINAAYPIMDQFNYLIANANISNKQYYLDASEQKLGFGKLGLNCYNGDARIFSTHPFAVNFSADSLDEGDKTIINIANSEDGKIEGSVTKIFGYYTSLDFRKENKQNDIKKNLTKLFPTEISIDSISLESVNDFESPITLNYNFKYENDKSDILYFNPMLTEALKENPFKSANRYYPVELPYCINDSYMLSIEIPKGYIVDELPKSTKVSLNKDQGSFKFFVTNQNNVIEIQSIIKVNKANFDGEDYESIRTFFKLIVQKHSEQIVFKKIK